MERCSKCKSKRSVKLFSNKKNKIFKTCHYCRYVVDTTDIDEFLIDTDYDAKNKDMKIKILISYLKQSTEEQHDRVEYVCSISKAKQTLIDLF